MHGTMAGKALERRKLETKRDEAQRWGNLWAKKAQPKVSLASVRDSDRTNARVGSSERHAVIGTMEQPRKSDDSDEPRDQGACSGAARKSKSRNRSKDATVEVIEDAIGSPSSATIARNDGRQEVHWVQETKMGIKTMARMPMNGNNAD
jgi:hypothetical protein